MTGPEHDRLAALETRLFGLDGQSGLAGDVRQIKNELAEWRGAMRLVKAASSFVGFAGLVVLLKALSG